jgi:hypothetical protein
MSTKNEPKIEAFIGASGSGKGVSINRRLAELKPERLLIWDPRDEYGKLAPAYSSLSQLVGAFKHAKAGKIRARFVPAADVKKLADPFAFVCQLAFKAGNIVFLAEELSDVTTASHAPAAWRQVITQGRHQGLHVMGAAQRPAVIDKTFLGNCTYIRCFGLRYREDRRAMAAALDVPEADVTALKTTKTPGAVTINFIERDFREDVLRKGQIKLRVSG